MTSKNTIIQAIEGKIGTLLCQSITFLPIQTNAKWGTSTTLKHPKLKLQNSNQAIKSCDNKGNYGVVSNQSFLIGTDEILLKIESATQGILQLGFCLDEKVIIEDAVSGDKKNECLIENNYYVFNDDVFLVTMSLDRVIKIVYETNTRSDLNTDNDRKISQTLDAKFAGKKIRIWASSVKGSDFRLLMRDEQNAKTIRMNTRGELIIPEPNTIQTGSSSNVIRTERTGNVSMYNATSVDHLIIADNPNCLVINLPSASANQGQLITVMRDADDYPAQPGEPGGMPSGSLFQLRVNGIGGDTVDGLAANLFRIPPGGSVELVSDGQNAWQRT